MHKKKNWTKTIRMSWKLNFVPSSSLIFSSNDKCYVAILCLSVTLEKICPSIYWYTWRTLCPCAWWNWNAGTTLVSCRPQGTQIIIVSRDRTDDCCLIRGCLWLLRFVDECSRAHQSAVLVNQPIETDFDWRVGFLTVPKSVPTSQRNQAMETDIGYRLG
jgi:hypothetical protein